MIYSSLFWGFQGLSVTSADASAIEESNAMALAIVPSGNQDTPLHLCLGVFCVKW